MYFSVIVPVYNRPEEIREFLESLALSDFTEDFEVVVIEDGSSMPCAEIVDAFRQQLNISYYFKSNSGPGDSRNFGMKSAKGNYFLIFDSDCIIPAGYLREVNIELTKEFTHCFGGPDKALDSFSDVQKAINFAMTSFLTTGGVRGGSEKINSFQPRSFNMGLSHEAFEKSGGFGNIHPGEDPDLVLRLWKLGYKTRLFPNAYVFHKRRIDWEKFRIQVNKFGKARPILNLWHPEYIKPTYFFPSVFIMGFYLSTVLIAAGIYLPILLYIFYIAIILFVSALQNKSFLIGWLSTAAVSIQFFGYGNGFIKSLYCLHILKKSPQEAFPELFFKK